MCRHYIIVNREPKAKPSATATGASKTKTDQNRAKKTTTNKQNKRAKTFRGLGRATMERARKRDRGKKEQNCSVTKPFKYTRCQGLARFPAAVKSLW